MTYGNGMGILWAVSQKYTPLLHFLLDLTTPKTICYGYDQISSSSTRNAR